ncbi:MAG: ParB/RepB/Spo0J family partition protein [Succinivibrionaceae bacterium]
MSGLNKGTALGALLRNNKSSSFLEKNNSSVEQTNNNFIDLEIGLLQRGIYQPRKDIEQERLLELADSIKSQGIIQPIVVRPVENNRYEIIAGERRWQAAKLAGLIKVPCIIKQIADNDAMAIALIENIQREDLNVIEQAEALLQLSQKLSLTHEELAKKVGKSRTTITNIIRLNSLSPKVKELVIRGELEMGHARSLLSLPNDFQESLALTIVQKGLTVRETEKLVYKIQNAENSNNKIKKINPVLEKYSKIISNKLDGCNVSFVSNSKNKGKVILSFNNVEELESIKKFFDL